MPKQSVLIHALTVGEVSKEALSRVDLAKTRLAAETQVNLLPKTIGSAYFRPGFGYLSTAAGLEIMRPFAISSSQDAIIHFRAANISVSIDGVMVTRAAVSSTVTNGDFAAGAGWTLTATGAAISSISGGLLQLQAVSQGSIATARQSVTTTSVGALHALRIVIDRGSCDFMIGTTVGGAEILGVTTLGEGTHSISFTPTAGTYHIKFIQNQQTPTFLSNCQIEAAGVLSLPTSYGASDLRRIRVDQSGDIMFLACDGKEQRRIERRALYSWSVTRYLSDDGPLTLSRTAKVGLSVAELYGSTTMTASDDFFTSNHGGSLISLFHNKQGRRTQLSGDEEYTIPIRVAGINEADYNDRDWSYSISGTWVGTLKWSRAYGDEDGGYSEFRQSKTVATIPITANVAGAQNDDNDDNAITFYRLGFESASYTSGSAVITVSYDGGTTAGIARIVSVSSPTSALVDILRPPGSSSRTNNWRAGKWSQIEGYPAAPSFYDGRLFWAGKDLFWGSVSDNYYSFDEEVEGDSAPIIRNMAVGRGVQQAKWMLPLSRLIIGTEGCEIVVKSSNFDEPLTATGITLKAFSDYGSADDVAPVIAGNSGLFIDRTTKRMIEISDASGAGDYASDEVTKINRDILSPGVWDMAVQRNPDTRAWIAKTDGGGVVLTYDRKEEIVAFTPIEAGGDGELQSICVSRQNGIDRVTALFKRTINSATVYTRERLALDSEIGNVTRNCQMDCYITGTNGPPSNIITGLGLLEGEEVSVWADGAPVAGTFTVAAGQITITPTVTNYVVGLPYEWRFKSAKLAYASGMGTPINQVKRVDKIGFQLNQAHNKGIQYGGTFDDLYDLPSLIDGNDVSNVIHDTYDHEMTMFNGQWGPDSRICLKGQSPYPCTVSGITFTVTTHDSA